MTKKVVDANGVITTKTYENNVLKEMTIDIGGDIHVVPISVAKTI